VLPLLALGLFVFQLDRMNLASALTGGFAKDIKITQYDVNIGNLLMYAGIVILEVPSNMALQAIGPRKWLSAQVFLFGLTASMQFLIRNRAGFFASRVMLGLAEAGYIPGATYTLGSWYRRQDLARRIAILFFGMFCGSAFSPLLASGILELDGRSGLRGWQWIFLCEPLRSRALRGCR
jgi:MFS family permease